MSDEFESHRRPSRVREVYDRIAEHFAATRHHPWPETREFCADVAGDVGLDIGCGNGRNAEVLGECVARVVALDSSRALLREADERLTGARREQTALVHGDAVSLPVAADSVDVAIYVATLHHLPDRERRRESLQELNRVLASGGRALVSAWSTTHDRFEAPDDSETGFDTTVDWTLPDGETVPRFYHIYAPGEFETDLAAAGLEIADAFQSSGNCYATVGPA